MDTDYADDMAVMDNTEGGLQESTDLIAHYSSVNVRPSDPTPKETLLTIIIELTAEGKPVTLSTEIFTSGSSVPMACAISSGRYRTVDL